MEAAQHIWRPCNVTKPSDCSSTNWMKLRCTLYSHYDYLEQQNFRFSCIWKECHCVSDCKPLYAVHASVEHSHLFKQQSGYCEHGEALQGWLKIELREFHLSDLFATVWIWHLIQFSLRPSHKCLIFLDQQTFLCLSYHLFLYNKFVNLVILIYISPSSLPLL